MRRNLESNASSNNGRSTFFCCTISSCTSRLLLTIGVLSLFLSSCIPTVRSHPKCVDIISSFSQQKKCFKFSHLLLLETHIQCTLGSKNKNRDNNDNDLERLYHENKNSVKLKPGLLARGGASFNEHSSSSDEEEESTNDKSQIEALKDFEDVTPDSLRPMNSNEDKKRDMAKTRRIFLDKITTISSILLRSDETADSTIENDDEELYFHDDNEITHQSDLMRPGRKIFIVTTAAIPWFTGTAVNPLLRAAYLNKLARDIHQNATFTSESPSSPNSTSIVISNHNITMLNDDSNNDTTLKDDFVIHQSLPQSGHERVTLVIPWLELEEDRLELYGEKHLFQTPHDQELYIREWLRVEAGLPQEADSENGGIDIIFYPARYHSGLKSIFAMGDICSLIPDEEADVCILEEPEHLNWFRHPSEGWTKKFNFVIGIVHTNYKEYASAHYSGLWTSPAIGVISSAMVRAYCHTVIKLSGTLQTFAEEKEKISNVHGVRSDFIKEGQRRSSTRATSILNKSSNSSNDVSLVTSVDRIISDSNKFYNETKLNESGTNVYFIGKILWAKGLEKMLELQDFYKQCTGRYFHIDIYGNGPEMNEIKRAYHGRRFYRGKTDSIKTNTTTSSKTIDPIPEKTNLFEKKKRKTGESLHTGKEEEYKATNDEYDEATISDMNRLSSKLDRDGSQLLEEWLTYINELEKKTKSAKLAMANHITKLSSTIQGVAKEFDDYVPRSKYEWRRTPIPATFPGRVDHGTLKDQYKIFVNPSISEVLCTTTAEALAMGKFAIIPVHPSNEFFMQFPNCLAYRNNMEFAANLGWALSHEPEPLTENQLKIFSWEAATERLVQDAAITRKEARDRQRLGKTKLDERIAWFHKEIGKGTKGDKIRKVLGGGPVAEQVKYEMSKKGGHDETYYNSNPYYKYECEDDGDQGLSEKFLSSSLAKAIRNTFAKSPTLASNETP